MEAIFALIKDNSDWLFGGSSVAAIALAYLNKSKPDKAKQAKPSQSGSKPSEASGKPSGGALGLSNSTTKIIIAALVLVAIGTGTISISNVNFSSQSITSGDGSVNVTADDGSNVSVETNSSD